MVAFKATHRGGQMLAVVEGGQGGWVESVEGWSVGEWGEVSVGGWIEVVVPAALGRPTPDEPSGGFQSHARQCGVGEMGRDAFWPSVKRVKERRGFEPLKFLC